MGIFSLVKNIVILPVAIISDGVELIIDGEIEKSNTVETVNKIAEDVKETL